MKYPAQPFQNLLKLPTSLKFYFWTVTLSTNKIKVVRFFISFSFHLFYSHKKTLQGLQALQPNNNTKLIIKRNNS